MKRSIKVLLISALMAFLPVVAYGGVIAETNISSSTGSPGDYNPFSTQGLNTIVSNSLDVTNQNASVSASGATYGGDASLLGIAIYAGYAVEPMADIQAHASVDPEAEGYQYIYVHISADASALHMAVPRTDAPVSIITGITQVPTELHWAYSTSGVGSSAWVQMDGLGLTTWGAGGSDGEADSGVQPFLLNAGQTYNIAANAGGTATGNVYGITQTNIQAVADPFLVIDPDWEYAAYFMVLQQSNIDPTKWVEVTRAWQDPAPVSEPGTMMLLGSGLAGLVGYGRKRFRK